MTFRNALARFESLGPKERAALTSNYYGFGECRCILGHLLPSVLSSPRHKSTFSDEGDARISFIAHHDPAVLEEIQGLGLTVGEAEELQQYNDRIEESGLRRYERLLEYLRELVLMEAEGRTRFPGRIFPRKSWTPGCGDV